jgi:hypothetical protein
LFFAHPLILLFLLSCFEKNYLGSLLGGGVINVPYLNLDQC